MTTPQRTPTTLKARTPEDLLAMVPYILGFRPEHSLVLLTFGAPTPTFHARVDLPDDPSEIPDVVALLVDPVRRHRVPRAVLIAYTDDTSLGEDALGLLATGLAVEGVEIVEMLQVRGNRWFSLMRRPPGGDASCDPGVAFDERSHPFAAQAVLEGRVTLNSREELADTLVGTDLEAIEQLGDAVMDWGGRWAERDLGHEALWVQETVARCVADGVILSTTDAGHLLVACQELPLRDVAWGQMSRDNAAQHVNLWRDVLRRTPPELEAVPATLLAFAAWLAGHGALAWCALDRATVADPDYSMARLVGDALEQALPPTSWEPMTDLPSFLAGP